VPVYEYRCKACGHELEEVQPMGSGPPGACPVCGGELRRVYGRVGVRFSGWGFSRTDALLPEARRQGKDFREVERRAQELTEG
jgi:putative FmdB family regulatory protein